MYYVRDLEVSMNQDTLPQWKLRLQYGPPTICIEPRRFYKPSMLELSLTLYYIVIAVVIPRVSFLAPRRTTGILMSDPRDSASPISGRKSPRFASEFASVAELTHLLASSFSTWTYSNYNSLSLPFYIRITYTYPSKCLVNAVVPPLLLRAALPPALPPLLLGPRLLLHSNRSLTRLPPTPHRLKLLLLPSSRAPVLVCSARWPPPLRKLPYRLCDFRFPTKSGVRIDFPEIYTNRSI